ncbi:MAG: CAP domain-containing protein [Actinomycetia bacterium]|nr:CAP domain-containing protein [Actinomycetes bacterium]MCP4959351.1 CAP domain-containing protein [Actinomycetes bacterium]
MRTRRSTRTIAGAVVAFLVFTSVSTISFGAKVVSASESSSAPVVDISATPSGYLVLHTDGTIRASGTTHRGDVDLPRAAALSATPSGNGYWIVGANGSVHAYGDATFAGDLSHLTLAQPIIAMATTASGQGYWLVGADGGVFSFGDAAFLGSMGNVGLASPVVDITATASGRGYWLVGADGGVFAFGDASYHGSLGGLRLDRPVIGITTSTSGSGYFMVASDGGVFAFGDAPFLGSVGGTGRSDIAALSPTVSGAGYYVASSIGQVIGFGDAITLSGPEVAEANLLARINAERALRGRSALAWDPNLAAAAETWSADMSRNGLRHSDLDAVNASMPTIYSGMGENIFWGSWHHARVSSAHQWLMDSATHRAAIAETAFTSVGLGVACVDGEMWVTEVFGRSASTGNPSWSGAAPSQPRADLSGFDDVAC